jgi:hypothetical protein
MLAAVSLSIHLGVGARAYRHQSPGRPPDTLITSPDVELLIELRRERQTELGLGRRGGRPMITVWWPRG